MLKAFAGQNSVFQNFIYSVRDVYVQAKDRSRAQSIAQISMDNEGEFSRGSLPLLIFNS